ncbi:MAG TPA: glycosyltransferase, partial [Kaistiaceae bacterium]|nr:glycosyltransferase [Kaistiaceae bacterium]
FRLVRLIRRLRPGVVQSWMYHADLVALAALLLSGRRGRTALFWGVRCSDMDLSAHGRVFAAVVRLAARLSGMPDGVVANSERGRQVHEALGYRPKVWHVVDNGIDVERFRPDPETRRRVRAELGIAEEAPLAIAVARVDPMKDYPTLAAALADVPELTCLVAGLGTEHLAGPTNMRRLGERQDIEQLLAAADLMVSSSAYGEGFSNAIAEAMATGLAVVATDVGDNARLVGDAGTIVPPRDATALAAALAAFARDRQALAAAGKVARARIADNFTVGHLVRRFDALHDAAAAEKA